MLGCTDYKRGRPPPKAQGELPHGGGFPANPFVNDDPFDAFHERTRQSLRYRNMVHRATLAVLLLRRCLRRHDTGSFAAFTGRALMIFRSGFALNIVGSCVYGLMPFRAFMSAC